MVGRVGEESRSMSVAPIVGEMKDPPSVVRGSNRD